MVSTANQRATPVPSKHEGSGRSRTPTELTETQQPCNHRAEGWTRWNPSGSPNTKHAGMQDRGPPIRAHHGARCPPLSPSFPFRPKQSTPSASESHTGKGTPRHSRGTEGKEGVGARPTVG